jgi:quinol monooxygenase YgiN
MAKFKVKPGKEAELQRLNDYFSERVSKNEPNYGLYYYSNGDQSEWTVFEIAADAKAMAHHMAEHGRDPQPQQQTMSLVELTSLHVYGDVPPEIEEMVKQFGAQVTKPSAGTFDRTIVAKNT